MNDNVKRFILDNQDLINNDKWEDVYEKAINELNAYTGIFTELMLEVGIHPEEYLKELPEYFLSNSNTKEFIIPDNIIYIGNWAFLYCHALEHIVVNEDVKEIGEQAFYSCKNLTKVIIRNPEIEIAANAFIGCQKLDIQFNGTIEQWKIASYRKFRNALYTCTCIDGRLKKSR